VSHKGEHMKRALARRRRWAGAASEDGHCFSAGTEEGEAEGGDIGTTKRKRGRGAREKKQQQREYSQPHKKRAFVGEAENLNRNPGGERPRAHAGKGGGSRRSRL